MECPPASNRTLGVYPGRLDGAPGPRGRGLRPRLRPPAIGPWSDLPPAGRSHYVWAMKRLRGARLATGVLAALWTGVALVWGALALSFSAPGSATARAVVGVVFVVAMGTLIVWVRPRRLGWPLAGGLFAAGLVWWLVIPARKGRERRA